MKHWNKLLNKSLHNTASYTSVTFCILLIYNMQIAWHGWQTKSRENLGKNCCICQFTCLCLQADHDPFNTADAPTHHSNEQTLLMWLYVLQSMLKCLPALLLLDCEDVKQLCWRWRATRNRFSKLLTGT